MIDLNKLTSLQDALNEVITTDWKQNRTEIDFMVASTMEMAELIDTNLEDENGQKQSLGWKWWKNAKGERTMDTVDWDNLYPRVLDNIKIELTDLLFFTLSQKVLGDLADEDEVVQFSENDWINFMSIEANLLLQRPSISIKIILYLADKIGFNITAYYCAKHTLNHIRQLKNYNDTYKKVNNGVEDNELLHSCIADITTEQFETSFEDTTDLILTRVYDKFEVETQNRKTFETWLDLIKN